MKQLTIFIILIMICTIIYLSYENYSLRRVDTSTRILWKDSLVTKIKTIDTTVYNIKHITRIVKEDTSYQVGFRFTDKFIDISCTTYWSTKGESKYKLKYLIPADTIKHMIFMQRGLLSAMTEINNVQFTPSVVIDRISGMEEKRPEWDRAWVGAVTTGIAIAGLIWIIK